MSGENKFFFEEDVTGEASGVKAEEQADLFGEAMSSIGIESGIDSMAPKAVELIANDVREMSNPVIKIEYGIVANDYVIHVTPTHPQRNLKSKTKLDAAVRLIIVEMNNFIPYDLSVNIHLPQDDWDIKVISFLVKGAASAWNFDRDKIEASLLPILSEKLTDICVKI